jgi:uncharacterized protein
MKSPHHSRKLPHNGVYTRLKPSKIHGVGVFAIVDIPKGTDVFADEDEPIVWIDKSTVEALPKPLGELYHSFAIIKEEKYGCPRSFNNLTISWYLNHSERPNMTADSDYRFYAVRDIRAGEELTIDYRSYSELPVDSL